MSAVFDQFIEAAWALVVSEDDIEWINNIKNRPKTAEPCGDLGVLVTKILDTGVSRKELAGYTKRVQYDLLFRLCYMLEDPASCLEQIGIEDDGRFLHGRWKLFETDDRGNPKRALTGLQGALPIPLPGDE